MTVGHLVFAIGMSSYILIAIRYEERDLAKFHGQAYTEYQKKVPMLIPNPGKVHDTVKEQKQTQGCPFSHHTPATGS